MDFTNATVNDMDMFIGGLNNAIKGLPEGYTVYFELQRNVVHKFQPSTFKSSLLSLSNPNGKNTLINKILRIKKRI